MNFRLLGLSLATLAPLCAQEPVPEPPLEDAADLRRELQRRDVDLATLAARLLGNRGGNDLFYMPTRDQPATPARWGFKFEEVTFPSSDGTELNGWFLPARAKSPKGTVVFSHGNAGSIGHHLGFVMWLVEARYNVFLYDYRGFGKSGGAVDRRGMLDDVKAAFAYVSSRADVDADKLVSFGHSLGGAKSVTALAETPVKGLRAVIIDGAFASYQAMAHYVAGQTGADLVTDEWSPLGYVGRLSPVPLLVVHGSDDEVVPFSQGRQLYEKAKAPKTLFEVPGGRHGDSLVKNRSEYRQKMLSWLDETLAD